MLIYRIDHNMENMELTTIPKKVKVESSVHLTRDRDPRTGEFGIVLNVVYDFGMDRTISFGVVTMPNEFVQERPEIRRTCDNDEDQEGRLGHGRF